MKLISNNLRSYMTFPLDTTVRINSAWVNSTKELEEILEKNYQLDVFLDFPNGRTKPPKPVLSLEQLIQIIKKHKNIKYFAISNSEDCGYLGYIRNLIPKNVELVPKIETKKGINNISRIVSSSECKRVMLDKEDLYLDCDTDTATFNENVYTLRERCFQLGVEVLELRGVFFA